MEEVNYETERAREVEYYAASLNAWFATKLEYDKSLLVLSAGGVGVLVTLLTTRGAETMLAISLYAASLFCFLVTLVTLLFVFHKNADHIQAILERKEDLGDKTLARLDTITRYAFGAGVAFAVALGIVTACDSFRAKEKEREKEMAEQKQTKGVMVFDSVLGAANLRPQALSQRSFNGASALRPNGASQPATPGAAQASTAPSATAPAASSPIPAPSAGLRNSK